MSPADLDSTDRKREERDGAAGGTPTVDASRSPLLTQGTLIGIPAPVSPRDLLQLAKARMEEDGVPPNVTQLGRRQIWEVRQDPFNDRGGHPRVNAIEATVRTLPSAPALGAVWQEGQAILRERRGRRASAILDDAADGGGADVESPGRRRQRRGSLVARLVAGAAAGVFMAVVAVAAFHTKAQDGDAEAWRPKATVQASPSVAPITTARDTKEPAMGSAMQALGATAPEAPTAEREESPRAGAAAAKVETGTALSRPLRQIPAEAGDPAPVRAEIAASVPEPSRQKTRGRAAADESVKEPDVTRTRKEMSSEDEPASVQPRPFQPSPDSAPGHASAAPAIVGSATGRTEQTNAPSLGVRPANETSASTAPPPNTAGKNRVDNRANPDPDAILPLSLD